MSIAVLSLGSRGDVQPFIALAAELAKRGHDVRLVTHANFAELAAGRGIAFEAVEGSFQTVLNDAPGLRMTASGRNPFAALRAMREINLRYGREWWTQLRDLRRRQITGDGDDELRYRGVACRVSPCSVDSRLPRSSDPDPNSSEPSATTPGHAPTRLGQSAASTRRASAPLAGI
jgi:hypothetical protein